eukprot:TRINITY_DN28757_c0_g1_i2.p2 TRINITY_DN28757_c0_g1~~TRINITY_DN28757_c0_g1_i2.p2  ORF type:complete len:135 (+),score=17.34 TRINITY_DN28757_c0_g1_i2:253-657(+)
MGCGSSTATVAKEDKPPIECPIERSELNERGWHKKILEPGNPPIPVGKGKKVRIDFKGYTADPPHACFGEGKGKEAETGKGFVKGMNKGLPEMAVGETAIISCAPHHGYGEKALPGVPENSTLLFRVTLTEVVE